MEWMLNKYGFLGFFCGFFFRYVLFSRIYNISMNRRTEVLKFLMHMKTESKKYLIGCTKKKKRKIHCFVRSFVTGKALLVLN